jgi:hypothetical protein
MQMALNQYFEEISSYMIRKKINTFAQWVKALQRKSGAKAKR